MNLHANRLILAVSLSSAVGSVAHAQQTEPAQTPQPVARTQPWSFSLGVNESYESDVQFSGTTGDGDWSTRLGGQLGRTWALRRGSVNLGGDVSQILYRRTSDLDRFTYGAGFGVGYSLTRRLSLRASETLSTSYAEDSVVLREAALVFPRVLTRTNAASTDLTYQLSPRSQLSGGVSATTVFFEGSTFVDGSSFMAQAAFARQVAETQSIGVSFGNTFSSVNNGNIQGLMGTWQGTFGRRLTLSAAGGVRPYKLEDSSEYRFAPGGSFGLTMRFARTQSLAVSYERTVEQAFGFNRTTIADLVNANYGFTVGRRLSFDGGANYRSSTDASATGYRLDGRTASLGMQYLLGRRISLGIAYGIWERQETGTASTTSYRTIASLTYGTARLTSGR